MKTRTMFILLPMLLMIAGAAVADPVDEPVPGGQDRVRTQTQERIEQCLNEGQGERLTVRTREQIRERLNEADEAGLPVEPIMAKVQEGLRKGASDEALLRSVDTMAGHLADAAAVADAAISDGASAGQGERAQTVRTMAMAMWGGLQKGDLDRLRTRARDHLQDGSCDLKTLGSAAETAVALQFRGVDAIRAVNIVGEALQQGYSASELRAMRAMTETFPGPQARIQDMVQAMEGCLGDGMGSGQMIQHMVQEGWMGQSEMGGHGPIDTDPGGQNGQGEGGQSGQSGQGSGGASGSGGSGGSGSGSGN